MGSTILFLNLSFYCAKVPQLDLGEMKYSLSVQYVLGHGFLTQVVTERENRT